MYTGLNNLGLTGLASSFSPSNLFTNGEGGAHFETYDPQSLLRRRNQLTYSEFPNGTADLTSASGGFVTASAIAGFDGAIAIGRDGVTNQLAVKSMGSAWAGATGVMSVIVQMDDGLGPPVFSGSASSSTNDFALFMGAILVPSGGNYTVTDLGGGLYRVTGVGTVGGTASFGVQKYGTNSARTFKTTAWHFEPNVSTFTSYQKVTDWNTEYIAAVGAENIGMWQDSAGTTATYAVEQPVGKWIDKSGRGNHATQSGSTKRPLLSARVNLLTKTEQLDDPVWVGVNAGTGVAPSVTKNYATAPDGTQTANRVVFNKGAGTSDGDYSGFQQTVVFSNPGRLGVWLKTADGSTKQIALRCNSFKVLTVTGSWGWFTYDEPSGVGQYQLILRGTYGTSDSADLLVWHPDIRTADDAAKNIPAYQRVNTASDYDTTGFPHYLKFDGIDDSLQTGSIDLTSFDKISVWAGSTKGSDSAASVLTEFTATSSTTAGSFAIFAPDSATSTYAFRSRGATLGTNAIASGYAAPNSYVVTGLGDISGDSQDIRMNGVSANTSTTDQGTGNFTNDALNIGSRNNASLFHNGRLYSLTVRASTTPTSESAISSMNRYAGNLMKIYF